MKPQRNITWRLTRTPSGWAGIITLPSGLLVGAHAATKKHAARRSAGLAARVAQDPMVRALLPPQATLALDTVSKVLGSKAGSEVLKGAGSAVKKLASWF